VLAPINEVCSPCCSITRGALALVTIHVRHFRNWYLFSRVVPEAKGHIEYPRGPMLSASAFELLVFTGLYGVLWMVTAHPFLLGGAASCAFTSFAHYRFARRHEANASCRLTAA
jgi:hypothetical protein